MSTALELRGVDRDYAASRALDRIDLRIAAGERVALVGPSGAGKSTLLALASTTVPPTRGQVLIFGQDPTRLGPGDLQHLRCRIGTVHQGLHLVGSLRVIHNVNAGQLGRWSLARSLWSLVHPLGADAAAAALDRVGIAAKLWARTDELSAGEQQRVAIARVLVQDPELILADEVTANLDPERGREVMQLLEVLSREGGRTLLASLHTVDFALTHFDRVLGLRHGRLVFDLPAARVSAEHLDALYEIDSPP